MTFVRTPPPKASPASSDADRSRAFEHLAPGDVADEAIDELAALFLTPSQHSQRDSKSPVAKQPYIELLVPGHLPVRGNLWLTPYADAVAREAGCCTLLRMDGEDEFSIQAVRGEEPHCARSLPTVKDVVEVFASVTQVWMVRPASPLNFQQLVTSGADRLTILTGTDGISVVAAYQLIKDLANAAAEAQVTMPELGVVVVGVDEQAAKEMLRRLNLTASSFLEADVKLRMCLPKLDAAARCSQHITFSGEPCPPVNDLVKWIKQVERKPASAARVKAASNDSEVSAARAMSQASSPQRNGSNHHEGEASVQLKLSPKFSERAHESTVEFADESAPSSLTERIAGLKLLQPRCPGHESIELAVDEAGVLQVIGRDCDLRSIQIVSAWVATHGSLLAMACAPHTIDLDRQAICHVVTDTPSAVADLHGSHLRLHVQAPVKVGGRTGWFAAPLN